MLCNGCAAIETAAEANSYRTALGSSVIGCRPVTSVPAQSTCRQLYAHSPRQTGACIIMDMTALIQHSRFFDHLVELVPAKHYYDDDLEVLNLKFMKSAARVAAKATMKEQYKINKRAKLDPSTPVAGPNAQQRNAQAGGASSAPDSNDAPSTSAPASSRPGAPSLNLAAGSSSRQELLDKLHKKIEVGLRRIGDTRCRQSRVLMAETLLFYHHLSPFPSPPPHSVAHKPTVLLLYGEHTIMCWWLITAPQHTRPVLSQLFSSALTCIRTRSEQSSALSTFKLIAAVSNAGESRILYMTQTLINLQQNMFAPRALSGHTRPAYCAS